MSTISIGLKPDEEQKLQALAEEQGKDVGALLKDVIAALVGGEAKDLSFPSGIDRILDPFRRGFAKSGMTEQEAEAMLDGELEAVRSERYAIQKLHR